MNDGQMPEDETAFTNEKEKQVSKQKINQSRRKFTRAGLIGVPAIITLTSKPVLAVNECTFSGNLSGNMSNARIDPCDTLSGYSPVYWLDKITSNAWSDSIPISVDLIGRGKKDVTPDTKFAEVGLFNNPDIMDIIEADTTFAWVLSLDPYAGGAESLAVHAVTALLNANTLTGYPDYVYSTAEVLTLYNTYYNDPPNDKILLGSFEKLNTVN